jgi:hypothetical protein
MTVGLFATWRVAALPSMTVGLFSSVAAEWASTDGTACAATTCISVCQRYVTATSSSWRSSLGDPVIRLERLLLVENT